MANLLTLAKVTTLAREAGFPTTIDPLIGVAPSRAIAAISMVEGFTDAAEAATLRDKIPYSDFDAVGDQALANDYWGYSWSGLQIRSVREQKGTGKPRDELRLPVPSFALSSALQIWKDCRAARRYDPAKPNSGFEPWSTFLSGQWKAYLQDVFPVPEGIYQVVAGDILGRIAQKRAMGTWQDWARVNALHDPNLIFIGQKLKELWVTYKAVPGDTMSVIFDRLGGGITYTRFLDFNRAAIPDPNKLAVGDLVRIPDVRL